MFGKTACGIGITGHHYAATQGTWKANFLSHPLLVILDKYRQRWNRGRLHEVTSILLRFVCDAENAIAHVHLKQRYTIISPRANCNYDASNTVFSTITPNSKTLDVWSKLDMNHWLARVCINTTWFTQCYQLKHFFLFAAPKSTQTKYTQSMGELPSFLPVCA